MEAITSHHILRLLEERHTGDVFVSECKDGPTQFGTHCRMDAWVMARSWANACATAYEIKVSRSDWLRDEKWRNYLPLANELYFVSPQRMIEPSEVPEEAGLIWTTKNATKLYRKKKAPFRDVEIPESLFRYVLMARATIEKVNFFDRSGSTQADRFRTWLEEKDENQKLGYLVRGRIRDLHDRQIIENEVLRDRMATYDQVRRRITELGFDPDRAVSTWSVGRKLEELKAGIPKGLKRTLGQAVHAIREIQGALEVVELGLSDEATEAQAAKDGGDLLEDLDKGGL